MFYIASFDGRGKRDVRTATCDLRQQFEGSKILQQLQLDLMTTESEPILSVSLASFIQTYFGA
jgi:hypothetical protein